MKSFSLVLFLFLLSLVPQQLFAQINPKLEEIYKKMEESRERTLPDRGVYEIMPQIFSWYPIGFIQLENYKMYIDKEYFTFLLTGNDDDDTYLTSKNILYRPDLFIVEEDIFTEHVWPTFYMYYPELYQFEQLIPEGCVDRLRPKHRFITRNKTNDLTELFYSPRPVGFLLILMTGKAYKHMTYDNVIDGQMGPLKFPDMNAYYRVLVPIWKTDSIVTTMDVTDPEDV